MRTWRRLATVLLFGLLLAFAAPACIRQELTITLREDGSGEYRLRKAVGGQEGMAAMLMPGGAKPPKADDAMPEGPVRRTYHITVKEDDEEFEEITYAFDDLGEALPILENRIDGGPRFRYENDRFVIFLNREKQKFDGQDDSDMAKSYYNLTINLPAAPKSKTGTVKGKQIAWKFSAKDIATYKEAEIGRKMLEAGIPAAAIRTDIRPRLVSEDDSQVASVGLKADSPLSHFSASIPILGESRRAEKENAQLVFFMPTEGLKLPVSYSGLEIAALVIDGKKTPVTLGTNTNGIFSKKDQWGRQTPGVPLEIEFELANPWVRKIDLLEARMQVATPTKTKEHSLAITALEPPLPILTIEGKEGGIVGISKIELGSSTASYPAPGIILLSTVKPSEILTCYLDTNYGLRYQTIGMGWTKTTLDGYFHEVSEELAKIFAGAKELHECRLSFRTVPNPPFSLVVVTITEKVMAPHVMRLEEIDVSEK